MVVASEIFLPWLGYRGIFAMRAVNVVLALVILLCFVRVPMPAGTPTASMDQPVAPVS